MVFDPDYAYTVKPSEFLSLGRATPFTGRRLYGRVLLTLAQGKTAWDDPNNIWEAN
jgi:dihydroorotase